MRLVYCAGVGASRSRPGVQECSIATSGRTRAALAAAIHASRRAVLSG